MWFTNNNSGLSAEIHGGLWFQMFLHEAVFRVLIYDKILFFTSNNGICNCEILTEKGSGHGICH